MAVQLGDVGKLGLLAAILLAATVMAALGVVTGETATYILVAELGYVTGNGVLARRGDAPSAVLVSRDAPADVQQLVHDAIASARAAGQQELADALEQLEQREQG
jgi:hypothetical protein